MRLFEFIWHLNIFSMLMLGFYLGGSSGGDIVAGGIAYIAATAFAKLLFWSIERYYKVK